nr:hypothetical protein [Longispora sp. (in: high G+C Gram-positive bacteria)]
MDLSPYLESLQRDLASVAAPGGPDISRAAALLTTSLEAGVRLTLLEVLSDAAAEITTQLNEATVEIRVRGRDADIVVTETLLTPPIPPPTAPADLDASGTSRI